VSAPVGTTRTGPSKRSRRRTWVRADGDRTTTVRRRYTDGSRALEPPRQPRGQRVQRAGEEVLVDVVDQQDDGVRGPRHSGLKKGDAVLRVDDRADRRRWRSSHSSASGVDAPPAAQPTDGVAVESSPAPRCRPAGWSRGRRTGRGGPAHGEALAVELGTAGRRVPTVPPVEDDHGRRRVPPASRHPRQRRADGDDLGDDPLAVGSTRGRTSRPGRSTGPAPRRPAGRGGWPRRGPPRRRRSRWR
jgi:hypothetical protein